MKQAKLFVRSITNTFGKLSKGCALASIIFYFLAIIGALSLDYGERKEARERDNKRVNRNK